MTNLIGELVRLGNQLLDGANAMWDLLTQSFIELPIFQYIPVGEMFLDILGLPFDTSIATFVFFGGMTTFLGVTIAKWIIDIIDKINPVG